MTAVGTMPKAMSGCRTPLNWPALKPTVACARNQPTAGVQQARMANRSWPKSGAPVFEVAICKISLLFQKSGLHSWG
jgi:hypothetical protein